MNFFQLNLDSPDALNNLGLDNSFSMEDFRENFRIDIVSSNDEELIFDMVGVDASIANALRRIMIAEVKFKMSKYSVLLCLNILSIGSDYGDRDSIHARQHLNHPR